MYIFMYIHIAHVRASNNSSQSHWENSDLNSAQNVTLSWDSSFSGLNQILFLSQASV